MNDKKCQGKTLEGNHQQAHKIASTSHGHVEAHDQTCDVHEGNNSVARAEKFCFEIGEWAVPE